MQPSRKEQKEIEQKLKKEIEQ